MSKDSLPTGHHVILDLFECGCDPAYLEHYHPSGWRLMEKIKKYFKVVGESRWQFQPVGWTGMLLLEESHCSIHTWALLRFVSVDLYTCSGDIPESCIDMILEWFQPKSYHRVNVVRGLEEAAAVVKNVQYASLASIERRVLHHSERNVED